MSRWSLFDPDADRRLVRGLNEGDEDTLIALYDAYAERLYDYCKSLIGDSKIAADTVHDCLIDACRRAPRMRDRMRLRAWLYGAARRRCLQRGRTGGLHWEWVSDAAHADAGADEGTPGGVRERGGRRIWRPAPRSAPGTAPNDALPAGLSGTGGAAPGASP